MGFIAIIAMNMQLKAISVQINKIKLHIKMHNFMAICRVAHQQRSSNETNKNYFLYL